jgi:hypothetical protein
LDAVAVDSVSEVSFDGRVLRTELRGKVTTGEVERWRAALDHAIASMPRGTNFGLLVDLRGYEPESIEAHKEMRTVIPRFLVAHGMRPALLDLFPETPRPTISARAAVRCCALALVHHHPEDLNEPEQRSFTDRVAAERWLAGRGVPGD